MRARRIVLLAVLALTGCASPYRPEGARGGYGETQLERNVFRVTYRGNLASTQAETDELALLRAADVAAQHGYRYFVSSGNAPTGTAISLATNVVSVPATTITIYCFETRPETSSVVYDAERIITTLGPKYPQP